MQIELFKNFNKKLNSTKIPSGDGTIKNVKLKEDCSISSPVFILDGVELDYNYLKFNNRFYFITDIVPIANNLMEVHTNVDLLASYRTQILNMNTFVERSASNYDNMINDNFISQKQNIVQRLVSTTDIGGGTEIYSPVNGSYLVRILNKAPGESGSSSSGIITYIMGQGAFSVLMNRIFNLETYESEEFLTGLYKDITKALFNPSQYIVDCYWLPVYLTSDISSEVYSGFYQVTTTTYSILDKTGDVFTVPISIPQNYYDDFRGYNSQWTTLSIWVPGIGEFDIDPINLHKSIVLKINVDYVTGEVVCLVTDTQAGIITIKTGSWKVPIQIGDYNSIIGGTIGSAVGMVSSAVGGNLLGMSESAINVAKNIITPEAHAIGQVGSREIFKNDFTNKIKVTLTNFESADIPNSVLGRPLYQNKTLSTLGGYTKCSNASIDIPGFEAEKDGINSLLNSGFYIE